MVIFGPVFDYDNHIFDLLTTTSFISKNYCICDSENEDLNRVLVKRIRKSE
jgi:hypothetical protein